MNKIGILLMIVETLDFVFAGQAYVEEEPKAEVVYYEEPEETYQKQTYEPTYTYSGSVLTRDAGMINGPTGIETWYNLPMETHIQWIREITGLNYPMWVRDDGVKMFGDYVMVAANLNHYPYGTIVTTSLGTGIVVDTGGFANWDGGWTWFDIATNW